MTWSHNAKWLSTNVDQWELRRRLGRRSTGNAVVSQYNGRGERGSIEPQSSGDCRGVPRHMADERLAWHIDRQRLVHPLRQTPLGDLGKRPRKCRLARRPRHATGPTAAATPGSPRAYRSDARSSEGPTRPLRERPRRGAAVLRRTTRTAPLRAEKVLHTDKIKRRRKKGRCVPSRGPTTSDSVGNSSP